MGLQAGYAYASTIDPNTQADSDGSGGLRATGGRAAVLRHRAGPRSAPHLRAQPGNLPGGHVRAHARRRRADASLGSTMFSTGLRLALPMVAILVMVDISLALLGRVNAQLQLLTIAFPVKMIDRPCVAGLAGMLLHPGAVPRRDGQPQLSRPCAAI